MNFKIFIGAIFVGLIFFTNNFAEAYDLPKIKTEKISSKKVEPKKKNFFKSDWNKFKIFEQKMKSLLAENENLSASAQERIYHDKNLIFVAVYKNHLYFLDRYSIKIKKNSPDNRTWTQKIFPVGEKVLPDNLKATEQTFHTDGEKFYNSSRAKNNLSEIEDEEDKIFLQECFKVGYFYAFGEES